MGQKASTPASVVNVLRRGRITALQKPDGGVRGIVVGAVFRRLVARTISQQLSSATEEATAHSSMHSQLVPVVCVAHAMQAMTDVDARATFGHHRSACAFQGCWADEVLRWRARQLGCAERRGPCLIERAGW